MAIPDYETLMLPLLQLAATSSAPELAITDAVDLLADQFKLTDAERHELLPSGGAFRFSSRVSWARTYLQKAGLLEPTRRGHFRITDRGRKLLQTSPRNIDGKLLMQYDEFRKFQGKKKDRKENDQLDPKTPLESIDIQYEQLRKTLAQELLEQVKKCSPAFFERLVVELLVRMGYGGSLQDAGRAIGRSGDGGVDGVIREDKLGLDNIYIQAKRWTSSPVGSPEINQFVGALSKKKASKGIFITTSRFTQDAKDSVRDYSIRMILIDGEQLANYMIDHNVGVAVASTYEIKRIDSDYFDEIGE